MTKSSGNILKKILLLIVFVFLSFLILTAGEIIGLIITTPPVLLFPGLEANEVWVTGSMYLSFIGIWIVTLGFVAAVKYFRPMLGAFGSKASGNNVFMLLAGLLLGFVMNGICVLGAVLHGDIHLHFGSFRPLAMLLVLFAVFIQSGAEELMDRGFLYQSIRKLFRNPWVAIILNSVIFGAIHLNNPGVNALGIIQVVLIGISFSLMVHFADSIWLPMAAHTGWNYSQAIIFGLPNSGIVLPFSMMKLEASTARNSFFYNVGFGVEGTFFALIVITIVTLLFMLVFRKRNIKAYDPWESER
ncbi:MAG: CPBP family intramembrane metalloprotease [Eubacterium sp.]|nr:CPBP family intramembrane metalloprotease [Eubacterium sp.]